MGADPKAAAKLPIRWQSLQETIQEISLLSWHCRISAFSGREEQIVELDDWADNAAAISVKFVCGAGGVGKSRLAAEFASRLTESGWSAGFVDLRKVSAFPLAKAGTLLIVDYPEEYRGGATELLRDLSTLGAEYRIRVLFLTRQRIDEWNDAITDANAHNLVDRKPLNLKGLDAESAFELFCSAHAFAARHYKTTPLLLSQEALTEWLKQSPENDKALFVVALAVHGALNPDQVAVDFSGREVVEALADRELQRLERLSKSLGFGNRHCLGLLLAMAAIADALSLDNLKAFAVDPKLGLGFPQGANLRKLLTNATVLIDDVVPAPKPDIVAAALLVRALSHENEKAPELVWAALELDIPGGLQRIGRLCYDAEQSLGILNFRLSEWLGMAVVDNAIRCEKSYAYLLVARLPRGLVRMAIAVSRTLRASTTDEARLAALLNNMAVDLAAAGETRPALEAIQEAVDVCRRLAAAEPTEFEPNLAMSLNNLAIHLSHVGDSRTALHVIQEAVDVRRRLAADDQARFEPGLASSLHNLANQLGDVGDNRAALYAIREAVEIRRRLAVADPLGFVPDLAASLNTLANLLSAVGDSRAALEVIYEAVEHHRRLAAAERATFEPDLAGSLNNLANRLSEVGDSRAALDAIQEAVDIRKRLAAAEPARFESDLAMSLNNLAILLSEVGDRRAALGAVQETVELHRRLATAEPARFEPSLAGSLNNLANQLSHVGENSAALDAIKEALDIGRRLAAVEPARFEPDLAGSLNNLANRLSDFGDIRGALDVINEAVELYRRLAAAESAKFEPDLARSLGILGLVTMQDERSCEAVEIFDEAISLIAPYAAKHPDGTPAKLRQALLESRQKAEELCKKGK